MTNTITKEKRENISYKLYDVKLSITCAFTAIALTMYLIGLINVPAVILILAGALWNFFVDINTMLSFLLSLAVGFLFAFFAIKDGLYVNALLYTAFYIPLQFIVWITNLKTKDMSIKYDKKMTGSKIYYAIVAFVVCFVGLFAFAVITNRQVLPLFDSFACCLLGLSAVLQSYMYREYYFIRPFAILVSILLWTFTMLLNGVTVGSITVLTLYVMYFGMDLISMIFWIKTMPSQDKEAVEKIDSEGHKMLVKEKIDEYNEYVHKSDDKKDQGGLIA